jgi:hypothetical protein
MKAMKKNKKSLLKPLLIAGVILLAGYLVVRGMMKTAQVAEISGGNIGGSCTSLLNTFDVSSACSADGFKTYTYSCKNNESKVNVISNGSCTSFSDAYAQASKACGSICTTPASATPRPSSTPTPPPPYPSPSAASSPTTTAIPVPTATTKATPSPIPSGCRMEQVKCIKAPCNPVMVCTTPTPTAVPKPSPIVTPTKNRCFKLWNRTICMPTFRR